MKGEELGGRGRGSRGRWRAGMQGSMGVERGRGDEGRSWRRFAERECKDI